MLSKPETSRVPHLRAAHFPFPAFPYKPETTCRLDPLTRRTTQRLAGCPLGTGGLVRLEDVLEAGHVVEVANRRLWHAEDGPRRVGGRRRERVGERSSADGFPLGSVYDSHHVSFLHVVVSVEGGKGLSGPGYGVPAPTVLGCSCVGGTVEHLG